MRPRARPETPRRTRALAAIATAVALAPVAAPAAAANAASGVSLPAIERQLMCVTCKIPLPEARSPQASRERALIASLIARGDNEAQIKRALRAEYGPAVFALPSTSGFSLAVYVIPPVVVLLALVALLIALPRWRTRARRTAGAWHGAGASPAPLTPADAARLDRDLARFDA
jgi:cytochrome c-type biogenesis protein CcmH